MSAASRAMHSPVVAVLALWVGAAACSGPDPGAYTLRLDSGTTVGPLPALDAAPDAPATDGSAAAPDAGIAPDPIFGTTSYQSNPPGITATIGHAGKGGPPMPGAADDCMGCHAANTKPFIAAGTVTDKAGAGVADVEVWFRDTNGKTYKANSDPQGNFWIKANTGGAPATLATPLKTAARKGTMFRKMTAAANSGSCNQGGCHAAGATILTYQP